jgi:hypothetical protein
VPDLQKTEHVVFPLFCLSNNKTGLASPFSTFPKATSLSPYLSQTCEALPTDTGAKLPFIIF